MSLTNLTREEVFEYIEEHDALDTFLSFSEVYDKDGNFIEPSFDDDGDPIAIEVKDDDVVREFWGVNTETGFSTFDVPMTEDEGKYCAVLFHKLINDHEMWFGDAEKFACSFVKTYNVMQKPMTKEEQEEVRQQLLACLDAGNVEFVGDISEETVCDSE